MGPSRARPPRDYDLRLKPARLRIFADNYQFMVFDGDPHPFEPFPEFSEATSHQGWTRNQHAIWFLTRAHYNAHRLDVRMSVRYERDPSAEAETVHNLRLAQGALTYFSHPNHIRFHVPPGDYMVYCRVYNRWEEPLEGSADLSDEEFFSHTEWERYELVLVPGVAPREGAVVD